MTRQQTRQRLARSIVTQIEGDPHLMDDVHALMDAHSMPPSTPPVVRDDLESIDSAIVEDYLADQEKITMDQSAYDNLNAMMEELVDGCYPALTIWDKLYDLRDQVPDNVDPDTVDLIITPDQFAGIVSDMDEKLKKLQGLVDELTE